MGVHGGSATPALGGLRVIDLSGPAGNYCGKMFAELGADVVLVEPPEGTGLRSAPPFADDKPGLERSLSFFSYNTSKRSVRLDIRQALGQQVVRDLARTAALVIETAAPGGMAGLGLGYDQLREVNPALVMTSITPFGQTGPYACYPADDLTCLALGGLLYLGGYADGPPVQAAENQAYAAGSVFGAVASMLAVMHAEATGEGQLVDVSIQECVTMGLENAIQYYDLEGRVRRGNGGRQRSAGYGVFRCADGYVYLMGAGIGGNRFWPNLLAWLDAEGVAGVDRLRGEQWYTREYVDSDAAKDLFLEVFGPFCAALSKERLYRAAQRWRVPLCPVNTPADVAESRQLRHRRFFVETSAFDRPDVAVPGAPYVLSRSPWRLRCPAPRLGEHTEEILDELGYPPARRDELRQAGVV